eukprot:jgi/Chlat1/2181/Chrsp17S02754
MLRPLRTFILAHHHHRRHFTTPTRLHSSSSSISAAFANFVRDNNNARTAAMAGDAAEVVAGSKLEFRLAEWPDEDVAALRTRLTNHAPPGDVPGSPSRVVQKTEANRAAVLVPLFRDVHGGDTRVLLTKRSSRLSTHKGEVSLPGGRLDPSDGGDDAVAALREAHEEIGLDPSCVNVVGQLPSFLSKHLLHVTPVVGVLSGGVVFEPRLNADESEGHRHQDIASPVDRRSEEREAQLRLHYFDHGGYVVWGLTAAVLIRAASVYYGTQPAFQEFADVPCGHR